MGLEIAFLTMCDFALIVFACLWIYNHFLDRRPPPVLPLEPPALKPYEVKFSSSFWRCVIRGSVHVDGRVYVPGKFMRIMRKHI